MHASLARIGRACTVDDEEPPATSTHSSFESPSSTTSESARRVLQQDKSLRDLVEKYCSLSQDIRILPSVERPFFVNNLIGKYNQSSILSVSIPSNESHQRLNELAQVHLLRALIAQSVMLDSSLTTFNELVNSLFPLYFQSGCIALGVHDTLESCLFLAHPPISPSPFISTSTVASISKLDLPGMNAFVCSQTTERNPFTLPKSRLDELSVICEHARQSLTQTKLCDNELDAIVSPLGSPFASVASQHFALPSLTDRFTSLSLINSYRLIYSGLSLLAHDDLSRFRHGELWQMMRGIEELDILSKDVRSAKQMLHSVSLPQYLSQELIHPEDDVGKLTRLMRFALQFDPLCSVKSVTVGYLFIAFVLQRASRLSAVVFNQLSALLADEEEMKEDFVDETFNSTSQAPPITLVDAFRDYLNKYYDRTASEYLRAEYEFIASFLNVLAQSTNLLYQVQKLQLMCSAAAAAQSKKLQALHDKHCLVPTSYPTHSDSHAVSVEGKHGILIRRPSGDKPIKPSKVHVEVKSTFSVKSPFSDALQRACTVDRFLATEPSLGALTTPGHTLTPTQDQKDCSENLEATATNEEKSSEAEKHASKKVVQWSDHREISTRHQVIGRFLEMIWKYTEISLNTLCLCPPPDVVESIQSRDIAAGQSYSAATHRRRSSNLTGCLRMSASQLTRVASQLGNTIKPDVFPAGLIPVLKRQVLKLDELAHRRRYYTVMLAHSTKPSICDLPVRHESQFDHTECFQCATISDCNQAVTPISTPNILVPSYMTCATRTLESLGEQQLSTQPQVNLLPFQRDLISMLRLLIRCVHQLCGPDVSHLQSLVEQINHNLEELGSPFSLDLNVTFSGHLQSSNLIHWLCETSRRLLGMSNRALHSARMHHRTITAVCHSHISAQFDDARTSVAGRLFNTIHWTLIHRTALFHLMSFINLLKLTQEIFRTALLRVYPSFPLSQTDVTNQTCFLGSVRQCSTPTRWSLPDCFRVNRLCACLKKLDTSMEVILREIQESTSAVWSLFLTLCCRLIQTGWSNNFKQLQQHPLDHDCLNDFLSVLTHPAFRCNATLSPPCPLHMALENHYLGPVFDLFCQHWFAEINRHYEERQPEENLRVLLENHTTSITYFRDALSLRLSQSSETLVSKFQSCPGFRVLNSLALTTKSTDPIIDPVSCDLTPAKEEPSSAHAATSSTCTSNRLPTTGDALFALATGVRTTFAFPFKQLARSACTSATQISSQPNCPTSSTRHISTRDTKHPSK